ncbi:MAG: ATP phosphoribosyltransferase [Cytophagales bacterium]|nr:ATP phosphoribosyltransferase [Cytophagales bacterium]
MESTIRIAIQKKGRLSEDSLSLIKECGIKFSNGRSALKTKAGNFPLEVFFLRDDDIPGYVEDGIADLGIVGENEVFEKNKEVEILKKLGFSKCRLSLAVPKNIAYSSISYFNQKNIATSYPRILSEYLKEKKINAVVHEISGSVEIAPSIGLAEGICDIVSSGSTLLGNGLKEVEQIFQSEAVLIATNNLSEEKEALTRRLLFRIDAVQRAKQNKYVMLNAPNNQLGKVVSLLPGMKSPTITSLRTEGWSSVQAVINENDFWQVIERLKKAGAEDIIVLPIEKMIL